MLELVYREHKPLIYKADIYRGKEENEWEVQKITDYYKVNNVK